jgi:hypothetical protein
MVPFTRVRLRRALHTNRLNGTIPTQIAQLTALTHLCDAELAYDFRASLTPSRAPCCRSLSTNQFTGTIPTQIAQLTALANLYVAIVSGGVSCPFTTSSQVLVQQSPQRTDSSVEFDNCRMVSDAFTLHLFALISSIPISNLQTSSDANCLVSHHPHSSDL